MLLYLSVGKLKTFLYLENINLTLTTMKNFRITTLLTATVALLSFSACSDDDDDSNPNGNNPPASSSISFDGKSYNMKSGLVIDYGATSIEVFAPETHYNYDFIVTDGPINFVQDSVNGDFYLPGSNSTISVNIELLSPDTSNFKSGTFNFIDEDSVSVASASGKYFFSYGEVELDNDGVVDGDFDGPEFDVVGGFVVVSGTSASNYSINYNLQVEGGRTLTGTYSGSFIYENDL